MAVFFAVFAIQMSLFLYMNWVPVLEYHPQVVELCKSSSLTPESGSGRMV